MVDALDRSKGHSCRSIGRTEYVLGPGAKLEVCTYKDDRGYFMAGAFSFYGENDEHLYTSAHTAVSPEVVEALALALEEVQAEG